MTNDDDHTEGDPPGTSAYAKPRQSNSRATRAGQIENRRRPAPPREKRPTQRSLVATT
jgi:hypothetical protein